MQASPMNLRYGASRFTAGASDLRYKANRIKGHVADTRWVGEAGTAFRQVCGVFITDLNKAADLLERTSNEFNTLAWRMEQIENLRRQIMYIEQDLWNLPYDDHYRQERANLSHQLSRLRQQVESEEREADQHATSAFQQILGDLHSLHFFAQDKSWWDELVSGAKAVGGFLVGIGAAIVDAVEGVFEMLIHFPQVLEGIGMLITEPGNVFQAIWGQVEESWKRDVTNGDAYSGGKWWGQAVGNVLLAVVGTKGLDKAVKVIKVAREAEVAATLAKAEKLEVMKPVETEAKATTEVAKKSVLDRRPIDSETQKPIDFAWVPTRQVDSTVDHHLVERVAEVKGQLSKSILKKGGNFAYADVQVEGLLKREYYAHSQIKTTSGNPMLNEYSIEPKGTDIIFKATEAPDANGIPYLRTADTEYKILNEVAKNLGDHVAARGKIILFTELDTCGSCNYIVRQFMDKYPNIEIEVIHNGGVFVKPILIP